MDSRNAKLIELRDAHNRAIERFNYAEASSIQKQIRKIQSEDPELERRQRVVEMQRENVQAQFGHEQRSVEAKIANELQKYRDRFERIQVQQETQLQKLEEEYEVALEREKKRPIPEVDHLFMRSKVYAKDHQYEYAEKIFNEALQRRHIVMRERAKACKATFKEQKDQLLARQANELSVLKEAIEASIDKINNKHRMNQLVIGNRVRIKEFKAGVWPPQEYTLGTFSEGLQRAVPEKTRTPRRKKVRKCNPRLDPTSALP